MKQDNNTRERVDRGWEKMAQTLEKKMPQKKKRRRWLWLWFLPVLGIAFGFFYLKSNADTQTPMADSDQKDFELVQDEKVNTKKEQTKHIDKDETDFLNKVQNANSTKSAEQALKTTKDNSLATINNPLEKTVKTTPVSKTKKTNKETSQLTSIGEQLNQTTLPKNRTSNSNSDIADQNEGITKKAGTVLTMSNLKDIATINNQVKNSSKTNTNEVTAKINSRDKLSALPATINKPYPTLVSSPVIFTPFISKLESKNSLSMSSNDIASLAIPNVSINIANPKFSWGAELAGERFMPLDFNGLSGGLFARIPINNKFDIGLRSGLGYIFTGMSRPNNELIFVNDQIRVIDPNDPEFINALLQASANQNSDEIAEAAITNSRAAESADLASFYRNSFYAYVSPYVKWNASSKFSLELGIGLERYFNTQPSESDALLSDPGIFSNPLFEPSGLVSADVNIEKYFDTVSLYTDLRADYLLSDQLSVFAQYKGGLNDFLDLRNTDNNASANLFNSPFSNSTASKLQLGVSYAF